MGGATLLWSQVQYIWDQLLDLEYLAIIEPVQLKEVIPIRPYSYLSSDMWSHVYSTHSLKGNESLSQHDHTRHFRHFGE